MSPYMLVIMIFSLILGTLITISSSYWLTAWMGLEINTLAIIPLMIQKFSPRTMEAAIKYFVIQTTATTTLLIASISNAWTLGQWKIQQINHPIPLMMISLALALKLGLSPVHAWFPEIIQALDLLVGLTLSTWQKLAPLSLMIQLPNNNFTLIITLSLLSILMGGWGGLNQTQLRKILSYSSIAHLGWMMLVLLYCPTLTLLTFTLYSILTFAMFYTFWHNQTTSINALSTSWTKNPILLVLSSLILLSLGGLPPLTGFLPKWMILLELVKQSLTLTATIAALSTLLSLYFYLRLSYTMALTSPPNNLPAILPWRFNSTQPLIYMTTSAIVSLCFLPLTPLITTFLFP
uniref:NADH-ubiquinone oxidoreductase chain 2 n=1 Tax=Terranatos dolichopterus TaxID=61836 RepID=Q9TD03_9TELE|nr:NADH dehydrogenase subunit II [Terranatos dolichopterus]